MVTLYRKRGSLSTTPCSGTRYIRGSKTNPSAGACLLDTCLDTSEHNVRYHRSCASLVSCFKLSLQKMYISNTMICNVLWRGPHAATERDKFAHLKKKYFLPSSISMMALPLCGRFVRYRSRHSGNTYCTLLWSFPFPTNPAARAQNFMNSEAAAVQQTGTVSTHTTSSTVTSFTPLDELNFERIAF